MGSWTHSVSLSTFFHLSDSTNRFHAFLSSSFAPRCFAIDASGSPADPSDSFSLAIVGWVGGFPRFCVVETIPGSLAKGGKRKSRSGAREVSIHEDRYRWEGTEIAIQADGRRAEDIQPIRSQVPLLLTFDTFPFERDTKGVRVRLNPGSHPHG